MVDRFISGLNFNLFASDCSVVGVIHGVIADGDTSVMSVYNHQGVAEDFRVMTFSIKGLEIGDLVQFSEMDSLDGYEEADDTVFCATDFKKVANDNHLLEPSKLSESRSFRRRSKRRSWETKRAHDRRQQRLERLFG